MYVLKYTMLLPSILYLMEQIQRNLQNTAINSIIL